MPSQTWTSNADYDAGTYSSTQSKTGNVRMERDYPSSYNVTLYYDHKVGAGNSYTDSHLRNLEAENNVFDTTEYTTGNTSYVNENSTTLDIANQGWDLKGEAENAVTGGTTDRRSDARIRDSEGNTLVVNSRGESDGDSSTKDWQHFSGYQNYDYLFDFLSTGTWTSETRTWSTRVEFDSLDVDSTLRGESVTITVYDTNGNSASFSLAGGAESFNLATTALTDSDQLQVEASFDNSADVTDTPDVHYVTVNALEHPVTPTNVRIGTVDSDNTETLWDDAYEYDDYTVYRAEASGSTKSDYSVAADGVTTESYTDSGREDGEKYFYRITSNDGTAESTLSAEVSTTTPLPSPTLDSLDDSVVGEITINYTLKDDSSDGDVLVERSIDGGTSWSSVATITDLTLSSYTDTALNDGEQYTYRLTRRTDHASQQTTTATATTILPAASGLSVTDVTGDQITVAWTDNANNGQYRVYVSRDEGQTWTNDSGSLSGSTTSYQTTALLDGEQYRFAVEVFTEHTSSMLAPGLTSP